ncbi:olfactory receptor 5V1-like [Microcaecilia unicolor]|uniref:Olfactory receptor n=1 Tax=Microcaecilia unicolor TaxID=1415580 RepID=A0A6P7XCJ1_9AMPH|nr:olfactory receptor 5V1-like [Microcaecilia unicolor]
MAMENNSTVIEFLLAGLSNTPQLHTLLFTIFFFIYATTLLGNLGLVSTVTLSPHLHTPMYFFLANLSLLDAAFASITVPKMLDLFLSDRKSISFLGCMAQMYCFQLIIVVECILLVVMGFDRYVAICKPLNYAKIMNRNLCLQLLASCWIAGLLNSAIQVILASTLNFCGPNTIDHFFCDIQVLLKLSCSDTFIQELILFAAGMAFGFIPCLTLLTSYYRIVSAILKINTKSGRRRAFSTCSSHLIVVALFYGSGSYTYIIKPIAGHTLAVDKAITVLYTILNPMFNPFIYSLRNMEVKKAFGRFMNKICFSKRI